MTPLAYADTVAAGQARLGEAWRRRWSAVPRAGRLVPGLALVVVLAALPVIDRELKAATGAGIPVISTPNTNFTSVLFLVGVYALCAIGLNVVVGLAGLLDLGYVGFFAVGAYTVAVFGSPVSQLGTEYPWLLCVPIAIAFTMLAGVILGGPTLRLRGDYLAIVTLGFGEIVRLVAVNTDVLGRRAGLAQIPKPPGERADGTRLFGVVDITPFYWLALGMILLALVLVGNLERSRVGRAWLAIREDEDAAELMGVPTFRFKLWAFAIGAAVGGVSGALFASRQGFINPDTFDVLTSILFLAAVVIGGAGNKFGVILGAVIVVYVPERLRGFDETLFIAWFVMLAVVFVMTLVSRRHLLLANAARTVATFAAAVAGLALALVVGAPLPDLLDAAGIEDSTPVLVGGMLAVLIVGAGTAHALGRNRGPGEPPSVASVFAGVFTAVLLGAFAPFAFQEIGEGVQGLRYFAFGLALIAISVFRPQGLLPSRRRAVELADRKREVLAGVNA